MADRTPMTCRPKYQRGLSVAERLDRWTRQDGECRVWVGYRDPRGYGRTKVDGVIELVHRVTWREKHGPIPPGMEVCHRCDNPPCREESHLFLGTHADNMADMVAKGRGTNAKAIAANLSRDVPANYEARNKLRDTGYADMLRGSEHPGAKLNDRAVVEIRASTETQQRLADRYGVSRGLIGHVKRGASWRHVHG